MKYPKIETLYDRDTEGNYGVIPGQLRQLEFSLIKRWLFTEKVDGRNHRIMLFPDGHIEHKGRTDKAQFTDFMTDALDRLIDEDKVREVINVCEDGTWPQATIYGELYGPKIQDGGKYRDDLSLCLFDVRVGDWWLEWDDVIMIADGLGLETVPVLGYCSILPTSKAEILNLFLDGYSHIESAAMGTEPEGIVARTFPMLFDRHGKRVIWKLKLKDFQ